MAKMQTLLSSISFKLWLPNLALVGLIFLTLYYFLPNKFEKFLYSEKETQLQILANTLANSVEISLNADDFNGLNHSLSLLSKQPGLKFAGIISTDNNGKEYVLAGYPTTISDDELLSINSAYNYKESPFSTDILQGRVIVAVSNEAIQFQLLEILNPILSLLFLAFLLSGLFLFFVSYQITKPIRFLVRATDSLLKGDYDLDIRTKKSNSEINNLLKRFAQLTINLKDEKQKNITLNNSLENKVKSRTTELEQTLHQLEKSQFLTRSVINSSLDSVIAIDKDGFVIEWNNSAVETFGYEKNEAIGKSLSDLIIPEKYRSMHKAGMKKFLETGKGPVLRKKIEIEAITKEGRYIDVELFISPVKIGKDIIFSSFIRDITESKRIQKSLDSQRLINKSILNSLPLNVTLKSKDGKYIFANTYMMNAIGKNIGDIIGKTDVEIYGEEVAADLISTDLAAWNKDYSGVYEEEHTINGEKKYIISGKYIIDTGDEDDLTNYLLSFSFDISDRKKAELELEKALKAKDEFLSTMSHEIRTPLHTIIGVSEILKSSENNENKQLLESLVFSSKHLMGLINDILDFSKINTNSFKFEFTEININSFLREIINQFSSSANIKGIDLQLIEPANLDKYILFDELRLSQIINNLLSNAIKFTEAGYVRLSCKVVNQTLRNITLNFCVEDTGIGIKKENIDKVKKAFIQETTGTSRKYGGTGLGLSIIDGLLSKLSSKLDIESVYGEGSKFSFQLSLKLGKLIENTEINLNQIEDIKYQFNISVLYVEDMVPNQVLMQALVDDWGINLELANSAIEGLTKSNNQKFDLILMDIQMPEIDGVTGYKMIRTKSKLNKKTPIVAFTANAEYSEVSYYKGVGFDDVLTKPITPKKLNQFFIDNFKPLTK